MHIAIIGAGFCGLALSYHLSKYSKNTVHIIESKGIGAGASGVAAGLLHPFVGAHSKFNWRGFEALSATKELIKISEAHLKRPVVISSGMLRPAINLKQKNDFKLCSENYPEDVEWFEASESIKFYKDLLPNPSIFVKSALSIDCENYLKGLFLASQKQGVILKEQTVRSLKELDSYDLIIAATGSSTSTIEELSHIKLQLFKGQVLQLKLPKGALAIPFPINSQAYLLMNPDGVTCTAGATYESKFTNELPDLNHAVQDILPKLKAFLPIFSENDVIDCKSGVRAVTVSKRPMAEQLNEKCWILTGMGPKGLLYHALLAKELTLNIMRNSLD